MALSPEKCQLLCTRPSPFNYLIGGKPLPEVHCIRDLGVLVTADLRFRSHIDSVAKTVNTLCKVILRTFAVRSTKFYLNLYQALVVPRLSYCAPVWSPHLKRDIELLEASQRRFFRRVSARCGPSALLDDFPSVLSLHQAADRRALSRILASGQADRFIDVRLNVRRGTLYRPKSRAKNDAINNSFAYRISRLSRSDYT